MFRNREDAAQQLARRLQNRNWYHPLVLAIPRGGVPLGAVLAESLGADLDVVLSRKLRAPGQPELALGAVAENGATYFNPHAAAFLEPGSNYLDEEKRYQLAEIARRASLFRGVRPPAPIAGRSVIVTDDGIATGSTMIAALQTIRPQKPRLLIVATPVVAPERLPGLERLCDEVVYLLAPERFWAIGQFYRDFHQVDDDQVVEILRKFAAVSETDSPYPQIKRFGKTAGTSKEAP